MGNLCHTYSKLPLDETDGNLCIAYYKEIKTSANDNDSKKTQKKIRKYYLPEVKLGFHIVKKTVWFPIETYTLHVYELQDELNYNLITDVKEMYISQVSFDKIVDIYRDQKYLAKICIDSIITEMHYINQMNI